MKSFFISKAQRFLLQKSVQATLKACFRFIRQESEPEGASHPVQQNARLSLKGLERACLVHAERAYLSTSLPSHLAAQEPGPKETAYLLVVATGRAAAMQLFGKLPAPRLGISLQEDDWARKLTGLAPTEPRSFRASTTAQALDMAQQELQQVRQQISLLYALRKKLSELSALTAPLEAESEDALAYLWEKHKRAQSEQVMLSSLLSEEFEEGQESWAITELLEAVDTPLRSPRVRGMQQDSAKSQDLETPKVTQLS